MIASIHGSIIATDEKTALVKVGGIGYEVYCAPQLLLSFSTGDEVLLWTHFVVRETSQELFGFTSREEVMFFRKLIDISGIGPRSALAILAMDTLEALKIAIKKNDLGYLTKVSGIGKKTAEKIILELRDKVVVSDQATQTPDSDYDVIAALEALGYQPADARAALRLVPADTTGIQNRIKAAMQILQQS